MTTPAYRRSPASEPHAAGTPPPGRSRFGSRQFDPATGVRGAASRGQSPSTTLRTTESGAFDATGGAGAASASAAQFEMSMSATVQTPTTAMAAAAAKARSTEITRFRVYARVRPFIEEEMAEMPPGEPLRSVVEMRGNTTILLDPKDEWAPKSQFEFDASLWSIPPTQPLVQVFADARRDSHDSQLAVYNLVAKPCVEDAFDAFNSCILTYGQTGSGKTYTMLGKYTTTQVCGGDGDEGIIPRVCNDIFQLLDVKRVAEREKPEAERVTYRVEVSFVEIYLERVRDLLDPALKPGRRTDDRLNEAKIRQDPLSGPFVEGVTKYQVESWSHCCTLLERGSQHRTTCATLVHQQSSRSHAIFQITIVIEEVVPAKDRFSKPTTRRRAGRINLVDLAGSERGGMTDYVRESAAINTSLLALRRVIDNLVERQNIMLDQARQDVLGLAVSERALPQVPYRDSVLTWLLSDSIGGNARTTMVATLSPLAKNYGDTLATLQWSSKARNLVTFVKTNDPLTMVQDGMSTRANDLNGALLVQRQNVDSLRETLHQKRAYAELLDHQTKQVMRETIRMKAQLRDIDEENSAITIQRCARKFLFAKRKAERMALIAALEAELAAEQEATEAAREQHAEAARAVEERETLLAEAREEDRGLAATLQRLRDERPALEERRARLQKQEAMIRDQLGADATAVVREIADLEAKVAALKAEAAHARAEAVKTDKRTEEMKGFMAVAGAADWQTRVRTAETELTALQTKIDGLKQRRTTVFAERDTVRAEHRKVFPPKK